MSSDASGEIYVVVKDQAANSTGTGTSASTSTSTGTVPASTTSGSSSGGNILRSRYLGLVLFSCIIYFLF